MWDSDVNFFGLFFLSFGERQNQTAPSSVAAHYIHMFE